MRFIALFLTLLIFINTPLAFTVTTSTTTTSIETPTQNISGSENPGRYRLSESTSDCTFWTDYPSEKVFKDETVPKSTYSGIDLYLAKDEFEPFQLVFNPTKALNIQVELKDKPQGIDVDLYKVEYVNLKQTTDNLGQVGLYPDPLYPIAINANLTAKAGENTTLWFSLKSSANINAGDYTMFVSINGMDIPVRIHVFDFAIPSELHVKSQINVSANSILEKYGVSGTSENYWKYVDSFKQFMIDHRLTPKSVLWSGGLTSNGGSPYIDYDSTTGAFSDPHGIWGFEYPADRYLKGALNTANRFLNANAFNEGTGFPSFMAMTFRNNDASADQRPDTFQGITRKSSDWYLNDNLKSAYNQKWFSYVRDLEAYLKKTGYLDKAYYYFANEPQDQADYDAVSWYAQALKKYAPNLRLMVSEEPKPEIFNNTQYPNVKIDQWLAVLGKYDPEISWDREANYGENTWVYFLHGTKPPYFNPITLDHPGIESKLTGWFLWKYRIKGIAHYAFNDWQKNVWIDTMTSNHNGDNFMLYPPGKDNKPIEYGSTDHRYVSSIRFELMRDSLEDYEYLYLLNNKNQPQVYQENPADSQVDKIIYGLTSYNRDSHYMYTLRKYIGMTLSGNLKVIPDIQSSITHERAETTGQAYYINFQDPSASPTDTPLVVAGKTYLKIGWNPYDETLGYGWYGDMAHVMYRYLSDVKDPLKASILYDNWGREKTFEFDLPNGDYEVTVSCGWQDRTYAHNKIFIEGHAFMDDESIKGYAEKTKLVTIKDNKLTLEMGIFDEYTMLNYLNIEPVSESTSSIVSPDIQSSKPSTWAVEGIQLLSKALVLPDFYYADYQANMTRRDYSELMVRTYMTLTDAPEAILKASSSTTFNDTADPWVLRAHALSIIGGYGNGQFGPENPITREQIAVVTINMLKAAGITFEKNNSEHVFFTDQHQIAPWALNALELAYENHMINGDGNGAVMPKSNLTREQALLITHNLLIHAKNWSSSSTFNSN
ncbi:glycoside hydrolase domain-containing protein [Fusibacter ferrireducens]|uniref:DUF4091 domain-containing protein n=1 Tax=Fusibacter ferrireducens TaxID=2785058 RepID=A0ABR9ZM53_9FIRM|nr:glycoside hydrolase domain-containing protein [Fusibacter ferrireducens]MBF4691553.1 DUF4091 domain-containing protein [Fusibacter ferrireducens]